MLSLLSVAAQAGTPLYWVDFGLTPGIDLGFFTLRWYSLAYLIGIVFAYWHTLKAISLSGSPMAQRHADDMFFYCTLGVILGGRLGYATFYAPELWTQPGELVKLWNGGMSFHGGLVGATMALGWTAWRNKLNFVSICDYVSVSVPMGMLLGRLANFVNGELWGRVTDGSVRWAMVFPDAGPLPRHPSQLYQAGLEGALLLVVMLLLFWKTRARFRTGLLVGIFAAAMGLSRFIGEFFREPDAQLAEFAANSGLSMGQWLTLPLIAVGLFFAVRALLRPAQGSSMPAA